MFDSWGSYSHKYQRNNRNNGNYNHMISIEYCQRSPERCSVDSKSCDWDRIHRTVLYRVKRTLVWEHKVKCIRRTRWQTDYRWIILLFEVKKNSNNNDYAKINRVCLFACLDYFGFQIFTSIEIESKFYESEAKADRPDPFYPAVICLAFGATSVARSKTDHTRP